jgi:hypothetical protein
VTASALSDNKIDIHVSVTINTHGSLAAPSNLSPAVLPLPAALTPVPSLSGVSCTLADLKKHRSQSRHLVVASASSAPHLPFHVTNSQSPFLFPAAEKTSSENNSPVPASLANVITDNEVKRLGNEQIVFFIWSIGVSIINYFYFLNICFRLKMESRVTPTPLPINPCQFILHFPMSINPCCRNFKARRPN